MKKQYLTLAKREFWEHRSLWMAPSLAAAFMLLTAIGGIVFAPGNVRFGSMRMDGDVEPGMPIVSGKLMLMTTIGMASVIIIAACVTAAVYLLDCLYAERKDRSILFWKSLPISDASTVLSKVVSATVLAPVIAVIAGIVVGMLQLLIVAITLSFHGINVWQLLVLAHPFKVMFNLIGYIPLYVLWALPSVGWLLLCSAWARNKPFLWAVALPVATGLLISWFGIMGLFNLPTTWFWRNVVQRSLLSVFPGTGSLFGGMPHHVSSIDGLNALDLGSTYQLLGSPDLWIGVAAGAALLAGAIWFRRWRDDS